MKTILSLAFTCVFNPLAETIGSGGTTKRIKQFSAVIAAFFCACSFSFGAATIPTYDGFDYSAGFDLGTQSDSGADTNKFNWTHIGIITGQTETINVSSENLTYPGLTNSVGNSITNPPGPSRGLRYHSSGGNVYNNPMFYSALIKVNSLGTLGTAGVYIMSLNNTSTTNQTSNPTTIPGRLYLRQSSVDGTKFNVGVAWGNSTVTPTYSSADFSPGGTIFAVVRGTSFTAGGNVTLWVNPATTDLGAASPPAGGLDNSSGTAPANTIQSLLIVNQTNTTPLFVIDEVRIGKTWADVTPPGAPAITTQPTNTTKDYGQTAIFSIVAATGVGTGTLSYQWQKNGSNLPDGGNVSGATTANLTLSSVSQTDEDSYRIIVTNNFGSTTSSVVTLTVNDPKVSAPLPANQSLPPGSTAIISATASGSPTLTFRWKKDGTNVSDGTFGGAVISGSATPSLTIAGVRAGGSGDGGQYTLSVTNGNGRSVTSSAATLSVIDPAITSQPQSQAKNYNESVTFSVTVSGTAQPFVYVWKKDGVNVTVDGVRIIQTNNGSTSTLTINNLTFSDQATAPGYSVVVTDSLSRSNTSSDATLTVDDPYIPTAVANVITNAGSTAVLKVQASGSTVLTYVWKTNGVAIADGATGWGSTISGATSGTLNIAAVTPTDAKTYSVEVSGAGVTKTNSGTLSVVQITRQPTPASLVLNTGGKAVFSAAASLTGPGTLTYQWQRNGSNISGETATAITITNAQTGNSGDYSINVIYGAGSQFIMSSNAVLTVSSSALQLSAANLVVARIGDGVQTLRNEGNSIYLDQFSTSGTYVNTITIPDSGTDALIAKGTTGDTIGGLNGVNALTLSDDGQFLVLNGYQTNYDPNATVNLGTAADTATPRAVTTINGSSSYAVRIESTNAGIGGVVFRSAAFDGVDEYWGATSGSSSGVYYFGTQAAAGTVGAVANNRIVSRFNGDLYFSSANTGLFHFTGKPHPGATAIQDITLSNVGGAGACDFAVSPDTNIIYIADGRNYSTNTPAPTIGGIQKWEKSGGVFPANPTRILKPDPAGNAGALYLTVDFSGANPVIYAATIGATQNKIVKVVDDGSNNGAGTTTLLATAGPNQQFRGIRFGPSAAAPVLSQTIPGAGTTNALICWSSVSGVLYRLEYKNDLNVASWTTLGTVTATNGTTCLTDTNSPVPAQRFYQVVVP